MSVINQMLQNIDSKKNQPVEPTDDELSYQRIDIPAKKNYTRIIYILLAGATLFAALWVAGIYDDNQNTTFNAIEETLNPLVTSVADVGVKEESEKDQSVADLNAVNVVNDENLDHEPIGDIDKSTHQVDAASPNSNDLAVAKNQSLNTSPPQKKPVVHTTSASIVPAAKPPKKIIEVNSPSRSETSEAKQGESSYQSTNSDDSTSDTVIAKPIFSMRPTEKSADELARKALDKGNEAYNRGRFSLAEIEYKKALSIKPALHEARAQWVGLLYGEKNHQKALNILQRGIKNYPEHTGYRLLAARVWLSIEQPHSALNVLLNHTPQERAIEYYQLSAALAQQTMQWSLALQNWQALLLNNQPQGQWLLGAAIAFEKLGKAKEADKHYKQALTVGGLSQSSLEFIKLKLTIEE
ncbi:tetratricopeptide repeat protein [Algibacillus agarilyticus]|uniref:tetratricopeptide repeat protein n=1 Tax=Algibacillus agarilyticus TaxID=2234133 RepID=UPI000DCF875F|nr:tetratricopeptide repeat protein [Algibacillus agarilyticus]